MDIQTLYQQTIKYTAAKNQEVKQRLPGTKNLPYVIHLCWGLLIADLERG